MASVTLRLIGDATRETPVKVGQLLTQPAVPVMASDLESLIQDVALMMDCDILFSPELKLNPLQLLRSLSRLGPRIALWPGSVEGRRVVYSEPGRRDYYEAVLSDSLILRPRTVRFPDEIPYEIERVP